MVGASESCADLRYAARFLVPDPFLWLQVGRKTTGVFSALEVDRARTQARVDEVVEQSTLESRLKRSPAGAAEKFLLVIEALLRTRHLRSVEVPPWTEAGIVEFLRGENIRVHVAKEGFFPGRELKTPEEITWITRGQRQAEAGMDRAFEVLRATTIGPRNVLRWGGKTLTSEILRGEVDAAVVRAGGQPAHTIVAGGIQGCDPHEAGHGPLRAHESLILDIFPRDQASGYYGDLTRTVVKGRASEALRKQYDTVLTGQKKALKAMKAGCDGAKLHQAVKDYFTIQGYPTEQRDGRWVGFFHGTGHSLGLEIHEAPRFAAGKFKAGQAMTVEPGLYYPETGGVRIEDLVIITSTGVKNLTRTPRFLQI